jgi:hypothetical protein
MLCKVLGETKHHDLITPAFVLTSRAWGLNVTTFITKPAGEFSSNAHYCTWNKVTAAGS